MNALVLDDEPRYREHVSRSLERNGLVIHHAANAREAIGIVDEHEMDLMVVDIRLPDEMDGLDFLDRSCSRRSDPSVIVMTGYPSQEYEKRSENLGAIAYLEKPFDLRVFERHVRHAIDHRQLLLNVRRLEKELQDKHEVGELERSIAGVPLVCVRESGEIFYVGESARPILDGIVSPEIDRPLVCIDDYLLRRMNATLKPDGEWGQCTVFRRDGILKDYQMFVRAMNSAGTNALVAFFSEGLASDPNGIDPMWMCLLFDVAASFPRRDGPKA